ncbi:MAG TPA: DUF445 domain-containing protein [Ilumatobacteraceae bacterium]|nr:DUF445 domain-containing protein [Ilumatobacteraceae bacterium]
MTATLTDADRAAGLRRMKVVATGMLVVAAVVYVIARANDDGAGWIGYVRAAAEASMVGALADWFAVSALFRHPLGIPIPHTAIIPRRKDQIGRSLGEFVEENFLTHDVLNERLADAGIGRRLGTWLAHPDNARRAADGLADALRGTLEVLDDAEVQAGLERVVESRVRAIPAAPMFGRAIDLAMEGGHHKRLLDAVLVGLGGFMEDNRTTFRRRLETESPWWIPESIDNRIFEKIYSAVHKFMGDVGADPDHEVRHTIDARLRDFAARLAHDPVLLAKGEELKDELLAHPDVREWLASLWGEAKRAMIAAAGDEHSELRVRITSSLRGLGERLAVDEELQRKVDDWVLRSVGYVIDHYRNEVSDMIAGTVERWDADTTSRKMELQVGRDLQFIRINGTIVGGLAGVVIHTFGNIVG